MRTIPVRRSLHRHGLILGAERDLVLYCGLIALLLGVGGFTILAAVTALIFWIGAVFVLRRMAKADPQMSKVWMRHIKYQEHYCAHSTPWKMP